ncbi:MAG: Crp/Fnr family transcriptional regulator [Lachnospiraceae bacterium]|nr:Crp/Fnr family transcriptional regulator [Lachnospiraceae bacterium]
MKKNEKDTAVLAQIAPIFDGITDTELKTLLHCMGAFEKSYEKGDTIIMDQDKVNYIGVILKGSVRMLKEDIWGNESLLGFMFLGDIFGESFAVQKESNSYVSFVANAPTDVLFLAASNIIHTCPNCCSFHAQISQNLFELLGQKGVRLMEKIEVVSKPTLREKILAYLSLEVQRQGSKYITLPLGRSDLADYLDANRSALTRELGRMRKEGILDFDGNTFRILL